MNRMARDRRWANSPRQAADRLREKCCGSDVHGDSGRHSRRTHRWTSGAAKAAGQTALPFPRPRYFAAAYRRPTSFQSTTFQKALA